MVFSIPQYPAIGEAFTLEIETPFTGLEMVRSFGVETWEQWRFVGKETARSRAGTGRFGALSASFMLVAVGEQHGFDAVRKQVERHGIINPQGQWINAFEIAFPHPDDQGPVGIVDKSWIDPFGREMFPCVNAPWLGNFRCANGGKYGKFWRWIVQITELSWK